MKTTEKVTGLLNLCGPMGVGKSTLVGAIACKYGLSIFAEHFRQIPYWKDSYTGEKPDFMKMQVAFLTQYLRNIDNMATSERFIADNQFYAGKVFVEAQHKMGLMSDTDFEVYNEFFDALQLRFPKKVITVVLIDSPEAIMKQIRGRGRSEEDTVTLEYVTALVDCWKKFLRENDWAIKCDVSKLAEGEIPEELTFLIEGVQ